jgi:hypothetical protein
MAAPELRSVQAGDLTLAYRELGEGPSVLLLRLRALMLRAFHPGLALGKALQVEQLAAHHEQVEPGQRRRSQQTPDPTVAVPAKKLDEQAAAASFGGQGHVRDGPLPEDPLEALGEEGDVAVALEIDQLEHRHEPLPQLELIEALGQGLGAATAEVVKPVVAVRRYA